MLLLCFVVVRGCWLLTYVCRLLFVCVRCVSRVLCCGYSLLVVVVCFCGMLLKAVVSCLLLFVVCSLFVCLSVVCSFVDVRCLLFVYGGLLCFVVGRSLSCGLSFVVVVCGIVC